MSSSKDFKFQALTNSRILYPFVQCHNCLHPMHESVHVIFTGVEGVNNSLR